jgi:hypothetical protein
MPPIPPPMTRALPFTSPSPLFGLGI